MHQILNPFPTALSSEEEGYSPQMPLPLSAEVG